jgi:hypothetical protein
MEIQDMIIAQLNRIEDKLDKHLENCKSGLTLKEWGIIAGIITTVCTTVSGIAAMIIK